MFVLHPAVVHFPIALLAMSVVLDAIGVVFKRAGLTQAGFYTLIAGGFGAALATLTGPEEDAKDTAARTILERHELFAAATVTMALILIGMRIGNAEGLRGMGAYGYLGLGVVLIGVVFLTGYFGGQMVYDHGVGVARLQGARAPAGEGGNIGEMWAKLGGIALVVIVVGYALYRQRFLRERFAIWRRAASAGEPPEQPTLFTLRR